MSSETKAEDTPDVSTRRTPNTHTAGQATWRQWLGLALLVTPMLVLASDMTVLFLALPTLSEEFSPTTSQSLWVVHIYGFMIAGLLVTMGRLGDQIGPRRLLLTGASAFAALSVVAAFSASIEMLIVTRALLGIAGATLMPSLLSLLRTMFRDDHQRRLAIAIMVGSFSLGGAIGPLLGGALLEFFWWGSIFLINAPPLMLLVVIGPRLLPESGGGRAAKLDLTSMVLSVAGMLGIVYGVQELAGGQETGQGATWPHLAIAIGGIGILGLFVHRQRRLRDPLFNLALLSDRRIATSLATLLIVGIGIVGMFFLVTQYLQWVAGLTPLEAGIWTLPYIVLNIAGSLSAPFLATRIRPALVVALGLGVMAAGAVLLLLLAGPDTPLPALVGGISVAGLGHGIAMALISDFIISSAPEDETGSAAAAQEVGGELGSAVGIAAGGVVSMSVYRAALAETIPADVPDSAADITRTSIHGGVTAARELGPGGPELLDAVHDAVTLGLQAYAAVGALLAGAAGTLVVVALVMGDRGGRSGQESLPHEMS